MEDKLGQEIIRRFEEALPIALLRTREAVMARFRPHLSTNGLTEQQWRVIRAVHQDGNIDATTLSDRCCILMPSLSRMLKAMEREGLVQRSKVIGDKRRQTIKLTETGQTLFEKMAPVSEKIYADIERQFGKDKISDLVTNMRSLRRSLDD